MGSLLPILGPLSVGPESQQAQYRRGLQAGQGAAAYKAGRPITPAARIYQNREFEPEPAEFQHQLLTPSWLSPISVQDFKLE